MPVLDELIASIYEAPEGPAVLACFDYDGTVIGGYSAEVFYRHRLRTLDIGPLELARTLLMSARGIRTEGQFGDLLSLSLGAWRGRSEMELEQLGERLFKDAIASRLHGEAWELLEAHRQMEHTLVLASSATRFQVEPMARELGIEHVLCTAVEVKDGRLTGRADGRPMWGPAKALALVALSDALGIDLGESFAYTNGEEDEPLLAAVGTPVLVEPSRALERLVEGRGWPVLRCAPRGNRPGITQLTRTAAFYGTFGASGFVGAGVGLLGRSRRTAIDIASTIGPELALASAGVDVRVLEGEEHLWSSRPSVFVFNHQSNVDPIVVMKLLKHGFTGVGKAEAKRIPLFGLMFQLAGVAFVERGNTEQARRALEPAVAKIVDERLSLMIAPEGTRSRTPKLGPFKKGAFHIAMQARVPMVPIVLRGAGEVMRRGDQTIRPGEIEVVVLPPVDTSGWRMEALARHVAAVRAQFERTLAAWPNAPARAALVEATL
jgi:putative phosphoserine phosphatase/1-acylglycerol-3-phosphate O-acyltransferase